VYIQSQQEASLTKGDNMKAEKPWSIKQRKAGSVVNKIVISMEVSNNMDIDYYDDIGMLITSEEKTNSPIWLGSSESVSYIQLHIDANTGLIEDWVKPSVNKNTLEQEGKQ
tara:strand:+ start:18198 stop:18530 length:333 start_codon:yes stop_codon:yes gene_type:complete